MSQINLVNPCSFFLFHSHHPSTSFLVQFTLQIFTKYPISAHTIRYRKVSSRRSNTVVFIIHVSSSLCKQNFVKVNDYNNYFWKRPAPYTRLNIYLVCYIFKTFYTEFFRWQKLLIQRLFWSVFPPERLSMCSRLCSLMFWSVPI